jgi:dihydrodipicolinate synthase/N-acetylneuraminate lyase
MAARQWRKIVTTFTREELSRRLYVAMVNPYKLGTYDLDESALRAIVRYFIEGGASAGVSLIVNPEAGEVFYMTREEKKRSLEIVLEEVNGRVPVVAGVMDVTTQGTMEVALDAKRLGADGLFLMPPIGAIDITTSWNPTKYPEVWLDQIRIIDSLCDMPIFTHPVGAPSIGYGIGLPEEPTRLICQAVPNIVGWKMTYNWDGWKKVGRSLRNLQPTVAVLGAPAHYFHEALASNLMDGTITGSFNYAFEPMLKHIEAWGRGDVVEATSIWDSGLSELQEWMYGDYSRLHIRYKLATWLRGLIAHPFMRPPMPAPTEAEIIECAELLRGAGLSIIDASRIKSLGERPRLVAGRE